MLFSGAGGGGIEEVGKKRSPKGRVAKRPHSPLIPLFLVTFALTMGMDALWEVTVTPKTPWIINIAPGDSEIQSTNFPLGTLPPSQQHASDLCFQTCASRFLTALVDLCKATSRKVLESKTLSFSGAIISDLLCKAWLTTTYVSECVVDLGRTQVGEFLDFVNLSTSSEMSLEVFCQPFY